MKQNGSSATFFAVNSCSFYSMANFFDHIYISQTNFSNKDVLRTNIFKKSLPPHLCYHTAEKTKFSIKDFLSKCDQIRRKLRIW